MGLTTHGAKRTNIIIIKILLFSFNTDKNVVRTKNKLLAAKLIKCDEE